MFLFPKAHNAPLVQEMNKNFAEEVSFRQCACYQS